MGDLISRKAALEIIMKYCPDDDGSCAKADADMREMLDEIEDLPAVDTEPVRRGKWIESYAYGAWHYDCPFCDDGYATKEREEKPVNNCSNCGAKLDKEEE